MARTNNLTNFLTDVANAIKEKKGDNSPIPAGDFDTEIAAIETGGDYQEKSISITTNGNYTLLPDTGYDAMTQVSISAAVVDSEYPTNLSLSNQILQPSYTELQYIQSTGNEKITTTIPCTVNSKIYIDFENTDGATDALRMFDYGTIDPRINNSVWGRWQIYVGSSNVTDYIFGRDRANMEISQGVLKINGSQYKTFSQTIASDRPLVLFNSHNMYSRMKLYSCKIYESDVLIHDFIPVKNINNVVCLYDKVAEVYYYNSGSGTFTAGPVKS